MGTGEWCWPRFGVWWPYMYIYIYIKRERERNENIGVYLASSAGCQQCWPNLVSTLFERFRTSSRLRLCPFWQAGMNEKGKGNQYISEGYYSIYSPRDGNVRPTKNKKMNVMFDNSVWKMFQKSNFEDLLPLSCCPVSDWNVLQKSNFEMSCCPFSDWNVLQKSNTDFNRQSGLPQEDNECHFITSSADNTKHHWPKLSGWNKNQTWNDGTTLKEP